MMQLKLDAEAIAGAYFDMFNEGKIDDNPHLCLRWLFNTCRNEHVCAKGDNSQACADFTMRDDEALVDPALLKKRYDEGVDVDGNN